MKEWIEPDEYTPKSTVDEVMQVLSDGGFDRDDRTRTDWAIRAFYESDLFSDMGSSNAALVMKLIADNYHVKAFEPLVSYLEKWIETELGK
jgi:hypothetical protein